MKFERARSAKQIENRKKEILTACASLYDQGGLENVNFKAISEMTSFSRPTIYNYYKLKEDILLDLLLTEVGKMSDQLNIMISENNTLTKEEYCDKLSDIYSKNERMLSLICILYSTIEKNCSLDSLTTFKKHFMVKMSPLYLSLDKFFPHATMGAKSDFIYMTSCYLCGLFPTTTMSEKQKNAIINSGMKITPINFKDMCYKGFLGLASLL